MTTFTGTHAKPRRNHPLGHNPAEQVLDRDMAEAKALDLHISGGRRLRMIAMSGGTLTRRMGQRLAKVAGEPDQVLDLVQAAVTPGALEAISQAETDQHVCCSTSPRLGVPPQGQAGPPGTIDESFGAGRHA